MTLGTDPVQLALQQAQASHLKTDIARNLIAVPVSMLALGAMARSAQGIGSMIANRKPPPYAVTNVNKVPLPKKEEEEKRAIVDTGLIGGAIGAARAPQDHRTEGAARGLRRGAHTGVGAALGTLGGAALGAGIGAAAGGTSDSAMVGALGGIGAGAIGGGALGYGLSGATGEDPSWQTGEMKEKWREKLKLYSGLIPGLGAGALASVPFQDPKAKILAALAAGIPTAVGGSLLAGRNIRPATDKPKPEKKDEEKQAELPGLDYDAALQTSALHTEELNSANRSMDQLQQASQDKLQSWIGQLNQARQAKNSTEAQLDGMRGKANRNLWGGAALGALAVGLPMAGYAAYKHWNQPKEEEKVAEAARGFAESPKSPTHGQAQLFHPDYDKPNWRDSLSSLKRGLDLSGMVDSVKDTAGSVANRLTSPEPVTPSLMDSASKALAKQMPDNFYFGQGADSVYGAPISYMALPAGMLALGAGYYGTDKLIDGWKGRERKSKVDELREQFQRHLTKTSAAEDLDFLAKEAIQVAPMPPPLPSQPGRSPYAPPPAPRAPAPVDPPPEWLQKIEEMDIPGRLTGAHNAVAVMSALAAGKLSYDFFRGRSKQKLMEEALKRRHAARNSEVQPVHVSLEG